MLLVRSSSYRWVCTGDPHMWVHTTTPSIMLCIKNADSPQALPLCDLAGKVVLMQYHMVYNIHVYLIYKQVHVYID